MKPKWLLARQTKYGFYLILYVVIVIAILGAVNYLANRYDKTFDATSNKMFSLSDQTRKIVKGLKENVKIYYFDTTQRMTESRLGPSPKDLLGRYETLSPKLSVEYVDPVKNPKLTLDMKVTTAGTVLVEVGDRREEAKSVNEEAITNALIRALKPNKRTACFLTGHGEESLDNSDPRGLSEAKQSLESSNFIVKSISLMEKEAAVPADCTVLVEPGPHTDLLPVEVQAVQKFIEDGGRALLLVDPETKGVKDAALVNLLSGWGVKVDNNLVVDLSGVGQLFGAGPEAPLVASYESHAITREMTNTASLFPLVRSIEPGTSNSKVSVEKLFSTSARSYAISDLGASQIKIDPKKDKAGPFSLAVAATYHSDKEGSPQGRFVAVGSSRFIINSVLGFQGNRDLFLNMMSWLSSDEDLISIRPKEQEDRRLTLTLSQMRGIEYTSIFAFPLLIIASGTYVWWRRR